MTTLSGWREQYDRMLRSHARLLETADRLTMASSDEARDALFHFFQDAYHLKDWIKNDPAAQSSNLEAFINDQAALKLCADLCNGTKHFHLTSSRTGDLSTGFTSQSVTVRPATVHTRVTMGSELEPEPAVGQAALGQAEQARPALHYWSAESAGQQYDALTLAEEIVGIWEQRLRQQGLLS